MTDMISKKFICFLFKFHLDYIDNYTFVIFQFTHCPIIKSRYLTICLIYLSILCGEKEHISSHMVTSMLSLWVCLLIGTFSAFGATWYDQLCQPVHTSQQQSLTRLCQSTHDMKHQALTLPTKDCRGEG